MRFLHCFAITLALSASLLAGHVHATDVSMANGNVTFSTPDGWLDIMDTQGDTETRVFQVPDPSPTGKSSLARVTVTVTQAPDINSFHQFMSEATAKAMALTGYKADAVPPEPNTNLYMAQENGAQFSYVEHYWYKNGHAIQLRCVRPAQSLAGSAWNKSFDQGCESIAAKLK